MNINEIRTQFVSYYNDLGFQLLTRAPMIHPLIPMSFVMSAGLVQIETSLSKAKNRSGNKFMLVQDCFRHFDLENVGKDDIHLSLFEMPGAFVFSKDGKQQTIRYMWELATEQFGINPNRIWASYFGGDNLNGKKIPEDESTRRAWIEIGVSEERLIRKGIDQNYWLQGGSILNNEANFRKCGPNTELFYDRGKELSCNETCQPGCKCGRFIEFSNSLFISYELNPKKGILTQIADPFIETVIGTERVAMILQGVDSVFETEFYQPIIDFIYPFINCNNLSSDLINSSVRVIADHLRALIVLIADGAPPPGRNGRQRIIKLLIRGVLTRQILLSIKSKEFLSILIRLIIKIFNYSKLVNSETEKTLIEYFHIESLRFYKTIEKGERKIDKILQENKGRTLAGSQILFLEKKYGLPHLLSEFLLRKKGLEFEKTDYKHELREWKKCNHN